MVANTDLAKILPAEALPIGLGCSRLGSVNGASDEEARTLIHMAMDAGIRFFDTSNIYGQGDSERLIAEVVGQREDCIVCSKAGKYLSWEKKMLVPFKGLLQGIARGSSTARQGVASARLKPMPTRWDADFLTRSIDASLKRLGRERIEMFMLHSPSAVDLENGEAVGALEAAQKAGKLGIIGVSVDDVVGAEAALVDSRVRCLQLPFHPSVTSFDDVATRAHAAGVAVVAREILGGAQAVSGAVNPAAYAKARIKEMIFRADVSMTLVGTTKPHNLTASVDAAKGAC